MNVIQVRFTLFDFPNFSLQFWVDDLSSSSALRKLSPTLMTLAATEVPKWDGEFT